MYAEEKNRLECTCIGTRNKAVLESALRLERNGLEQLEERLKQEKLSILKLHQSTDGMIGLLKYSDNTLQKISADLAHVNNLIDQISTIEICGN